MAKGTVFELSVSPAIPLPSGIETLTLTEASSGNKALGTVTVIWLEPTVSGVSVVPLKETVAPGTNPDPEMVSVKVPLCSSAEGGLSPVIIGRFSS